MQIVINNLYKSFHNDGVETPVLKGVSLSIAQGDSLAIVGASGAGKSTLLHLIGTLDRPSSGDILFEGTSLLGLNEKQLSRFRNQVLGFVFQFHHLLPDFTALENVMMPLLIGGCSQAEARVQAKTVLERVDLASRLSHRPSQLSGGEQQRVALARAVVTKPRVILADEPTGNLDTPNGTKIFDLLLSLNEELKTTLIVVTHNDELAGRLGQTVQMIDGKIQV